MINSTLNFRHLAASAAILVAATLSTAAVSATAPAQPHATPGTALPQPRILVIDRQAILRYSKVGQDIVRQVNSYTQSAQSQFKAEQVSLQKEGQALQQQVAILAPDVRSQKIRAFQAKEAAFRQKVETRQSQIQGGVQQARQQVENALGPIVQGIMLERQANLLLDRSMVVLSTVGDIDVTRAAVQRLDQKLPAVHVQLVSLPPGMQAGMQNGMQGAGGQ
ncbi:MAG TPA: OmpH family outer membrane protein [Rhizomicrobium sp.]